MPNTVISSKWVGISTAGTPNVVAALNAAIARTREQVEAVSVSIIPDKNSEPSKN
jgi:hypothetical protein